MFILFTEGAFFFFSFSEIVVSLTCLNVQRSSAVCSLFTLALR